MRFQWDPATGRYRTSDGRFINDSAVRSALDRVIDASAASMRAQTQSLVDGNLPLAAWTVAMMTLIKSVHLVAASAAVGGWRHLDPAWTGWTGAQIKPQYRWLIKFSVEISSGAQKLDGTVLSRAAMYAAAARETHREAQRRLARARMIAGEERRVLAPADHCRDCLTQAKLGWQPFGTLKRIGDSQCRSNCRCHFDFRAAA